MFSGFSIRNGKGVMQMHKILVADASDQWRSVLEQALGQTHQVFCCCDGDQALKQAARLRPDVVVLDLMLAGTDGLSVIKGLQEQSLSPRIIVTGRYFSNFATMALERYQVDSMILKPCSVQSITQRVEELLEQQTPQLPVCQDPYDSITALLVQLGARTSQQGFRFLRVGILLLMEDPGQQLTKSLYPAIAAEFRTSKANVEKSMRTTVANAWANRRDEVWRAYFPTTANGQIPRPTTGQFLSRLADAIACTCRRQA